MGFNKNVVVWSKQGCHYCNEVKSYLNERHIPFKTIDVTENDGLRDVLEAKYGVRYVPVVEIERQDNQYEAVVQVGIDFLKKALV
ncbi:glutaredoxin family protein [Bacillus sp. 03113]|uniref:glutaredoxin family protein n=1 Tax=Bacillus sp. 03113 TaxID=2578211 RepID=UPI001143C2FF|nr:glutaredoxin family protein [Bacillus sp. 03113]